MVQNRSKGLQKKASSSKTSSTANPKKGKRVIAPKKTDAVKHAALQRNLSAKINRSIEQQMVSTAGGSQLTILKPEAASAEALKGKTKTAKK